MSAGLVVTLIGLLAGAASLSAVPFPAVSPAPAPRPCGGPEFREFDFWVGTWDLRSTRRAGTGDGWIEDRGAALDRVEKALGGCAIVQHWDGAASGIDLRGLSLSTYDPAARRWRQIWVDSDGSWLEFAGGVRGGRMELYREGTLDGRKTTWRQVFSNIRPASLDWSYERSQDGGRTWRTTWRLAYTRRDGVR